MMQFIYGTIFGTILTRIVVDFNLLSYLGL